MENIRSNWRELRAIPGRSPQVAQLSVVLGLCFLVIGYDGGFMTVSMPYVKDDFKSIGDKYEEFIMVLSAATSGFGGLLSIWLNYMLGRQRCVFYSNFGFLVGYMIYVFATAPWAIVLSRVVVGVATGVALTTAPFMVAEAADPQSIRGVLVGILGLFFTVGVLLVNVMSSTLGLTWRIMPILSLCLNITQIFMVQKIPPQDQIVEAPAGGHNFCDFVRNFYDSLKNTSVLTAIGSGIIVHVMKRLSGAFAIVHFTPKIMELANCEMDFGIYFSSLSLLGAISSLVLVDILGRKPILVGSLSGMLIGLICLFLEIHRSSVSILSVIVLYLFIYLDSLGFATIPIIINAEVYPSGFKVMGAGLSMSANCVTSVIVSLLFPTLEDWLGLKIFGLYVISCSIGLIAVIAFVPETMDPTTEEKEAEFAGIRFEIV